MVFDGDGVTPNHPSSPALRADSQTAAVVLAGVGGAEARPTRILIVPGFVADTYSEIERSYVELSATPPPGVRFLWLVPEIGCKYNTFAKPEERHRLIEPTYVTQLRAHRIPYVVGNVSKYNALANLLLFRRVFAHYGIDAVYTHFGYERFWAALCAKLFGVATVWNEHWHSLGRRYGAIKRVFYRCFVDEFISVSNFITATLPSGARAHTIRNAVRATTAVRLDSSETRQVRTRLGVDPDAKMVLMVAAFRSEKRHAMALQVCAGVLAARKDVIFVFPGGGPLRPAFLAEVEARGLSRHVIAPGHVDQIDDYYAAADVSILTSLNEPFGYVLLEAMRFGLPVIAFDNGGPSEVIKNGETGFLISESRLSDFIDRLLSLIDDDSLRRTLGERARRVVMEDYNRDLWIRAIGAVLRRAAINKRRRVPRHSGA